MKANIKNFKETNTKNIHITEKREQLSSKTTLTEQDIK